MTLFQMYFETQVQLTAGRGVYCALPLFAQTRKARDVTLNLQPVARRR